MGLPVPQLGEEGKYAGGKARGRQDDGHRGKEHKVEKEQEHALPN